MNEKQYQEFEQLAHQCKSGECHSINVASKIRSNAIIAAWHELNIRSIESRQLRRALYNLVKFADQEQNTSTILFLGAMAKARTTLEGPIVIQKRGSDKFGTINAESKVHSEAVAIWQERALTAAALRELIEASLSEDKARFSIAIAEARKVLGDNE